MKLYLVQHGEANPKEVDPERGLSDRGMEDVHRVAVFLKGAGVRVNRVIHSGKLRALQTAEILASAVMEEPKLEVTGMINPTDPPAPFATEIAELTTDTMVVGHLPFMARMVAHLITGDAEKTITAFRPGSTACLERDEAGEWSLAWMVRPELIG